MSTTFPVLAVALACLAAPLHGNATKAEIRAEVLQAYRRQRVVHCAWTATGATRRPPVDVEIYREGRLIGLRTETVNAEKPGELQWHELVSDGDVIAYYDSLREIPSAAMPGSTRLNALHPAWAAAVHLMNEIWGIAADIPRGGSTTQVHLSLSPDESRGLQVGVSATTEPQDDASWLAKDLWDDSRLAVDREIVTLSTDAYVLRIRRADGILESMTRRNEPGTVEKSLAPSATKRDAETWRRSIREACRTPNRRSLAWGEYLMDAISFARALDSVMDADKNFLHAPNRLRTTLEILCGVLLDRIDRQPEWPAWVLWSMHAEDDRPNDGGDLMGGLWRQLWDACVQKMLENRNLPSADTERIRECLREIVARKVARMAAE